MKHSVLESTKTHITNLNDDSIQPNAIDFRVDKVFKIDLTSEFVLPSEGKTQHRNSTEILPNSDGFFELDDGKYDFVSDSDVKIGEYEAGWIIQRSSLNRNGITITSGCYDSGYNGPIAGMMHVSGRASIERGARIGQFLVFAAEMVHSYDGQWQNGKDIREDK